MEFVLILVAVFSIIGYKLISFVHNKNSYFKNRGINSGGFLKSFKLASDGNDMFHSGYQTFKNDKIHGMYLFGRPKIIVKDPDMISRITVKDFDHFVSHDNIGDMVDDIFSKSLLFLDGEKWKEMRNILSPIFTSMKLKQMFPLLQDCAEDLNRYFGKHGNGNNQKITINAREVFSRYSAEVISVTTLGFKGNCITEEHSEVYQMAMTFNEDFNSIGLLIKALLMPIFPRLSKHLGIKFFRQSIHDFFNKYVSEEISRREKNGIKDRNDVIQLLMNAKHNTEKNYEKSIKWSHVEFAAQAFIFFVGGFDTTSTMLQMCSWELANNPDIQTELCREIDEVVKELNGKLISYEILNEMKYLDMVAMETLRKWPSFVFTDRVCSRDYSYADDEGQTFNFKKGDVILIPIRCMQNDPRFFENPDKFVPERFSSANKKNIINGQSILTFGNGPRLCLGKRLSLLEAKLAIFTILNKYTFEVCDETVKEPKISPNGIIEKITIAVRSR